MDQFVFDAKKRWVLGGGMILGVVCLLITFFTDDQFHTRFWTNYLHNTVFFTGISLMSLFILAAFTTAFAGWSTLVKRIWEAYSLFLIPGLILFLVIIAGIWGHWHHLYHWADDQAVQTDRVLLGKSGFLNKYSGKLPWLKIIMALEKISAITVRFVCFRSFFCQSRASPALRWYGSGLCHSMRTGTARYLRGTLRQAGSLAPCRLPFLR